MLTTLPVGILVEISENFDIFTIISAISINKEYRRLLLVKKIRLIAYIKKIQKLYKLNLPVKIKNVVFHTSKDSLVRTFISLYPMKYLVEYPEFFSGKTTSFRTIEDKTKLQNYINNCMPSEDKRSRRDIKKFLDQDIVTKRHLLYAGW